MEIELKNTFESGDIEDVDGLFTAYDIIADGVKVGACSLIQWDDDSALIERIDIDEAFRGQGIGTKAIHELASLSDSTYIVPDNADAQRLYNRLGFEVDAESDWSYKDVGFGVYKVSAF